MDILLVNAPVSKLSPHAKRTPPLGLAYLGAVLLKAGYGVEALDLNATPMSEAEIRQFISSNPPCILGISTYTETHNNGIGIARLVKEINPEVKIVFGGPHASVLYEEVAREAGVDVVVIGEGEYTMLELAGYFLKAKGNLADINGIAFVTDGKFTLTKDREPITDPDELPFPARDLFYLHLYDFPISILSSRGGCPFACNFCAVNIIWKGKRRFRSPGKVLEEAISIIQNRQVNRVNFSDDSFTMDRSRVLELCRMLKETFRAMVFEWQCATRVDLVDNELLREMRFAGCKSIQYGVEAGSQKILDSIGKKIRLEQVKKAVSITLRYGMEVSCSFMFPHPEDTEETIREQIALMRDLKEMGAVITLAMTTPLPGTQLYENANELGINILARNWEEYDGKHLVITTKNLSEERLNKLLQEMVNGVGMRKGTAAH